WRSIQGKRFVRCRIGFTCCKVGFENNLEKLQEGGVSPHANTGRHVPPVRNVSAYGCEYGIFPGFRMERSGILEAMTLVSPVGMGRSMMQAHRRIG
ncbi:MAG: hypothetical protein QGF03_03880, partial [SAR324 cluster bacterium]|nr:hypothetical protein [SAR324 cluster bacterium]